MITFYVRLLNCNVLTISIYKVEGGSIAKKSLLVRKCFENDLISDNNPFKVTNEVELEKL